MTREKRGLANRRDLFEMMKKRGYTLRESGDVIDDVFDSIAELLISGKGVQIDNFGIFELEVYPGFTQKLFGRDEPTVIPERNLLRFRVSQSLKQLIKLGLPVNGRVVGRE